MFVLNKCPLGNKINDKNKVSNFAVFISQHHWNPDDVIILFEIPETKTIILNFLILRQIYNAISFPYKSSFVIKKLPRL